MATFQCDRQAPDSFAEAASCSLCAKGFWKRWVLESHLRKQHKVKVDWAQFIVWEVALGNSVQITASDFDDQMDVSDTGGEDNNDVEAEKVTACFTNLFADFFW